VINDLLASGNGFLEDHLIWLSWYSLRDAILDVSAGAAANEALDELALRLEQQGYLSRGSPLPRLRASERFAPRLSEYRKAAAASEELDVLNATLGRMEFQMAKLEYGVAVHVTAKKRNKVHVTRRRTVYLGRPKRVLGQPLRSVGRCFLPNEEIARFVEAAKKTGGIEGMKTLLLFPGGCHNDPISDFRRCRPPGTRPKSSTVAENTARSTRPTS